jgi:predicted dehydrogenase
MTEPVRWGVLGCANIALQKVIPAMQQSSHCSIAAIASRDGGRAAAAAEALGIPAAYGSYEELLADPAIEAVYLPLPNHLHREWTLRAAAAGKHVLCEKPLAVTASDAAEMVAGCRDAGVLLMEAFMYRLHPLWRRVHALVSEGAIGELLAVQGWFSYHNVDPGNIRNVADYGGGALLDIGCYPVNVARWLFDSEPTAVSAAVRRDPAFGTDVLTSALLDFGGRHATFTCSTQLEPDQRVHLLGSAGRLLVEIPFNIPPDRPTRIVRAAGGDPPVAPGIEVIEIPAADQYTAQGEAFSAAVREGTPVPTPPEDAVANLQVIEQIFTAASGAGEDLDVDGDEHAIG